jgi:hypothetical protein
MSQLLPDLTYLAILLIALLTPFVSWGAPEKARERWVVAAIVGSAGLLTIARHGTIAVVILALVLAVLRSRLRPLLGAIAAILLFVPVAWWGPGPVGKIAAAGLFILVGVGATYLSRRDAETNAESGVPKLLGPMALALLVGVGVGLLTGPLGSRDLIYYAWHHWGAYLAPVEAWLAGGLPYRDFPVQYGIGPTALLAATCGNDCWRGIYWTTVAANALYFAVLAGCVILLTARSSRGARWLALAALWCATFIWTAFPVDVGSTVMTPSVAGLRFLPIAALLLHILVAEHSGRRRDWIGHAIWLTDLFWSPEGAFFGTLVWWPYLAMRDAAGAENARDRWIALLRGAIRGLIAFAAGTAVLALFILLLSAGAARPSDFLAYILHPPGPLPINPVGTVWLALAAILLAGNALIGAGRSAQGRSLYACLLGFLAAGTYYLSRSHDNNILNLFPLLLILLLASVRLETSADAQVSFSQSFVRTVLMAMIAFVPTAGWMSWADAAASGRLLDIGPDRLVAHFTPSVGSQPQILPDDALQGLSYLRAHNAGAVVLLHKDRLIPSHPAGEDWTGVNSLANFEPLPPAMIKRFVCRGALAYRRPGWLLLDQRDYGSWLALFEAGYEVRRQVGFGSYRAYYLVPRRGPLRCAEL